MAAIRGAFPALARRMEGLPVAFFDGPGGTQVPLAVPRAMEAYLLHHNANTHWAYPTSEETDALILEARGVLAAFLNARPAEIVFGQNMTTLTFHLARGLGRAWGAGDEVVVTDLDHHANRAPWEALAVERGITLRVARFDPATGEIPWDEWERVVSERTRLVAVGAASNALGTVTDVARVCQLARERGAATFVDAVHSAPHALVDVDALGCDWLACSPYKFYGPHLGVLWGRAAAQAAVDAPRLAPAPAEPPERLETGTLSHEGIVGAAAAVRFLAGLGGAGAGGREGAGAATELRAGLEVAYHELGRRSERLLERLWEGLAALDGVTLHGPPPGRPRTPTLAFTLRGVASETAARHLAARAVFVSHGDFYAATVVDRLGLGPDGLIRAGCACYSTPDEVDRLVDGVAALLS